jgi:hypothetical protein
MNIKLLEGVRNQLVTHPEEFNYNYYIRSDFGSRLAHYHHLKQTGTCGTQCCIAGWTYMLTGGPEQDPERHGIESVARHHLELSSYEAEFLFHTHHMNCIDGNEKYEYLLDYPHYSKDDNTPFNSSEASLAMALRRIDFILDHYKGLQTQNETN